MALPWPSLPCHCLSPTYHCLAFPTTLPTQVITYLSQVGHNLCMMAITNLASLNPCHNHPIFLGTCKLQPEMIICPLLNSKPVQSSFHPSLPHKICTWPAGQSHLKNDLTVWDMVCPEEKADNHESHTLVSTQCLKFDLVSCGLLATVGHLWLNGMRLWKSLCLMFNV